MKHLAKVVYKDDLFNFQFWNLNSKNRKSSVDAFIASSELPIMARVHVGANISIRGQES